MHPSEALSPTDIFGARVVAAILDIALVAVSMAPFSGGAAVGVLAAFWIIYFGVVQGVTGFTAGKAVLGVRVVKAGTTEKPGMVAMVLRAIIAPIDLLAGIVLFIVNPRRRRLGDLAAGTEVVGLGEPSRTRAIASIAYIVVLTIFIAAASFNTALIIWAIFGPVGVGFAVVILGYRRQPTAWPWLAALGYLLPAACYLSFVSLCKRGEKNCVDVSNGHKAIVALVLLVIAIGIVFLVRAAWAHAALAALVILAGIWLFLRMKSGEDMVIGAVIDAVLLIFAIVFEVVARTTRRRAAELAALDAAAASRAGAAGAT